MFAGAQDTAWEDRRWTNAALAANRPASASQADNNEILKLFEAVVCGVDRLALDSAIIASGLNALRAHNTAITIPQIARFLPPPETRLTYLLMSLTEVTGTPHRLQELDRFLELIAAGIDAIQTMVEDDADIGHERARILHAGWISQTWRWTCRSAVQLIEETKSELRALLSPEYTQNAAVLTSLLSGAISGLSPCLDQGGALYVPPLPQQRRWPRHSVLQECRVAHDGGSFKSLVKDASAGGLGLGRAPQMQRNTRVEVIMDSGRIFDCTVAWSNGEQAGLKFAQPLAQTDPLLLG